MIREKVVFATLVLLAMYMYIANCNPLDRDDPMVDRKLKCDNILDGFSTKNGRPPCSPLRFERYDHQVLASVPNYCCHPGVFTYGIRHVRCGLVHCLLDYICAQPSSFYNLI